MKPPPEAFDKHKVEATEPVKEVLEHVYKAVLATPEFTLKDGTKARVDDFYPPEMNEDGDLACGFDVLLDNGTHLEFSMKNTGWGKSFADAHAPKKPRRGRGR